MAQRTHILVTGGAGFIGSALVWALNGRGVDRVLVSDVLDRTDKWRNLAPIRFDDYLDAADVLAAIDRGALDHVHTILHMGACSATTETDSAYLMRNNVNYTTKLAEWAIGRSVRFIYASSAATYGALEGVLSDEAELGDLRPLNMYGYSKHLFDLYASRRGYLDRIVGVKFFNVYGPNEDHKGDMRSVVNKAFQQIRDTGCVRLFRSYRPEFADGEQRRDFVYVKDAVDMTLHLMDTTSAAGLYNVGSGRSHTWIELVTAVFDALGKPAAIEFIEMPESLRPKYQYSTEADLSRLRATGYTREMTPLASAVKDYVAGYLVGDKRLGDEGLR